MTSLPPKHFSSGGSESPIHQPQSGLEEFLSMQRRERKRLGKLFDLSMAGQLENLLTLAKNADEGSAGGSRVLELYRDLASALVAASAASSKIKRKLFFPDCLAELDLPDELRELGRDSILPCQVEVALRPNGLSTDEARALLSVAQEAMENAEQHSSASQIRLSCYSRESQSVLEISDDGCGFVLEQAGEETLGLGLMRGYATLQGGSLMIKSELHRGTSIQCIL